MRSEIVETIEIPEGIEVEIDGTMLNVKKEQKQANRRFEGMIIEKHGNSLKIFNKKASQREKRMINTAIAHIKNMFNGLNKVFVYKLQSVSVHFPMSVSFDHEHREIVIKNFLGEKNPRKAEIKENVDVKIEKDIIILSSHDKEAVGQSAANIERATKIKRRDKRVFQDGCYIIVKAGEEI